MLLLTPDPGLVFWHTVILLIALVLLRRYAWAPILRVIAEREEAYAKAIWEVENAKRKVDAIRRASETLIAQAEAKKVRTLRLAEASRRSILEEAKERAIQEREELVNQALQAIGREREIAKEQVRQYAVELVIHATEKLLRRELADATSQRVLVEKMITQVVHKDDHNSF